MSGCQICQHAKKEAIDTAITNGRLLGVVATQFRVKKLDLLHHVQHAPIQAAGHKMAEPHVTYTPQFPDVLKPVEIPMTIVAVDETIEGPLVLETPQDVLKRGLPYVRQAVRLAGDDRLEQERIVATLNEVLQDENMGLP